MTGPDITRAFSDVSIRADAEGRTITGIVVPYDRVARVSDGGPAYEESFRRGAFAKTIAEGGTDRVKLLNQHDPRTPIGRAMMLREDRAGLYGEFRVSAVPAGDAALELVRDGVIDSFSVGFRPVKAVHEKGVTVRTEVAIREASLVTFPAYADARITALRAMLASLPDEVREEILTSATTPDGPVEEPERSDDEPVIDHSARLSIRWAGIRLALRERGLA